MFFCFLAQAFGKKLRLSKPRLHVPFNYNGSPCPPSDIITAFASKVEFTVENPAFVKVSPVDTLSESSQFKIEVLAKGSDYDFKPITTRIYFSSPKEEVRLDVEIDRIASVEIIRTSTLLYLNSTQLDFSILPKSATGSYFGTVIGYPVTWVYDSKYLNEVPKEQSDFEFPHQFFEEMGTILFQGIQAPAETTLKARISDPSQPGSFIESDQISIEILDPIGLFPKPIHIPLPGFTQQVSVCSRHGLKDYQELLHCDAPYFLENNEKYQVFLLSSDNESIAKVYPNGTIVGGATGRTFVRVESREHPYNRDSVEVIVGECKAHLPEQWLLSGEKPKTNTIILESKKGPIVMESGTPSDAWVFEGDITTEDRKGHLITARYGNNTVEGLVHVVKGPITALQVEIWDPKASKEPKDDKKAKSDKEPKGDKQSKSGKKTKSDKDEKSDKKSKSDKDETASKKSKADKHKKDKKSKNFISKKNIIVEEGHTYRTSPGAKIHYSVSSLDSKGKFIGPYHSEIKVDTDANAKPNHIKDRIITVTGPEKAKIIISASNSTIPPVTFYVESGQSEL